MSTNDIGFKAALEEAKQGALEKGVPIGACLVSKEGKILGRGHNMRMQKDSPTLHAEMSALENAGRLPASAYAGSTMYTTLSPCDMCTGACILYKVSRVVLGENNTFVGAEELLRSKGIEVINLKDAECEALMKTFIENQPGDWNEDIGEE
ncbi:CMP/dCMP deaminase zinc-binding protein [Acrodontium crateriforme]|uniref:Cytosine deaminase n=1 Tax=Acrodontium crateriforme TaxID=150365 RepID=A0AAQ3R8X6_9PEZI|nr:CMP/dCMP deaminase zinc-binding protein [Acrodontium crateriforme]